MPKHKDTVKKDGKTYLYRYEPLAFGKTPPSYWSSWPFRKNMTQKYRWKLSRHRVRYVNELKKDYDAFYEDVKIRSKRHSLVKNEFYSDWGKAITRVGCNWKRFRKTRWKQKSKE